jgi:hypothetical protein
VKKILNFFGYRADMDGYGALKSILLCQSDESKYAICKLVACVRFVITGDLKFKCLRWLLSTHYF